MGNVIPLRTPRIPPCGLAEVPLYQLFYDGEQPPEMPKLPRRRSGDDIVWGAVGKDARTLTRFRRLLGKIDDKDRKLLFFMAQKLARR